MVNAPEGLNQFFLGRLGTCEREKERPRFGKIRNLRERERERERERKGPVSEKFGKNQNLRCHLHLNASAAGPKITPNGTFL